MKNTKYASVEIKLGNKKEAVTRSRINLFLLWWRSFLEAFLVFTHGTHEEHEYVITKSELRKHINCEALVEFKQKYNVIPQRFKAAKNDVSEFSHNSAKKRGDARHGCTYGSEGVFPSRQRNLFSNNAAERYRSAS